MRCTTKLLIVGLALASCTVFTAELFAGQVDQVTSKTEDMMDLLAVGDPVASDVLETLSGGQSMTTNDTIDILAANMKLNADMDGNLLYSTSTGINRVSGEAFSHASGISTVVQNSGNQVIINNAFILNLQVQ